MKDEVPRKLSEKGLKISDRKTSEYAIKRFHCNTNCKDCNLLGNLPDKQNEFEWKRKTHKQCSKYIEKPVFKQRYHYQCENKAIQIIVLTNNFI